MKVTRDTVVYAADHEVTAIGDSPIPSRFTLGPLVTLESLRRLRVRD